MVSFFHFPCFGGSAHIAWGFVVVTLEKLAAVKRSSMRFPAHPYLPVFH